MREPLRPLDEPLQEQRRGDGAGERRLPHVVDVGNRAFEVCIVARPERQPPYRIADAGRRRHHLRGERVVVGEQRRQVGPKRHAGRARQRGETRTALGRFLVGQRQGVGEDQPPLGIGVADLDRRAGARSQHVAWPEGVAGDAVLGRRNQHAQAHVELLRHDHVRRAPAPSAAPPMSFFISSMPLDGLMSRPPVSKQMPLPTSVTLRRVRRRPRCISISRGARGAGAADGVDHREVLLQQLVAGDDGDCGAVALASCRAASRARPGPGRWPAC